MILTCMFYRRFLDVLYMSLNELNSAISYFKYILQIIDIFYIFFYLGFMSQPFTNHRALGEGGWYFFNSSLPLPPASQAPTH